MSKAGETQILIDVRAAKSDAPFQRADFVQVCRVDETYAITFHQTDYQAVADVGSALPKPDAPAAVPSRIVGRVALDRAAFGRLLAAIADLSQKELARRPASSEGA